MASFIFKPIPEPYSSFSELSPSIPTPKLFPNPIFHLSLAQNLKICLHLPSTQKALNFFWNPNCLSSKRSTISFHGFFKAGSKRKGKEPMREDSFPYFDHSSYPSRDAFKYYSTRNINYGRIPNFTHLDFMHFNQIIRRMKWLSFARINNLSYPSLVRRFYGNLVKPHKGSMQLIATLGDIEIELDPSSIYRVLGVYDESTEVFDTNSWPNVENLILKHVLGICVNPMLWFLSQNLSTLP